MDEGAADPLLAAYLERRAELQAYFRIRLRSDQAAQDLLQDIYLKVAARAPAEIQNPVAYLYRLGTNLMLDHIKHRRRVERRASAWHDVFGGSPGVEPVADAPPADSALEAKQRLDLIIKAVAELPAPVREAFRLHKLEGLSHSETAAAMGVSRSSVEKYMIASLKHIHAKVGP